MASCERRHALGFVSQGDWDGRRACSPQPVCVCLYVCVCVCAVLVGVCGSCRCASTPSPPSDPLWCASVPIECARACTHARKRTYAHARTHQHTHMHACTHAQPICCPRRSDVHTCIRTHTHTLFLSHSLSGDGFSAEIFTGRCTPSTQTGT